MEQLAELVAKLERVLFAKGVRVSWALYGTDGVDVRWNHKMRQLEWYDRGVQNWLSIRKTLRDGASTHDEEHMPVATVAEALTSLVTAAIKQQEEYKYSCDVAVETLSEYMANVGWYKPEEIDPVEPVTPEVSDAV